MKTLLLALSILISSFGYSQMSSDIKAPDLHLEPLSIQSIKDVWQSEMDENRKVGIVTMIAGIAVTGFSIYEGNEAWKRPTPRGWVYDPFFSQSTRPFMLITGLGITGVGVGIIIANR
jgi:hypothetical protein